MGEERRVVPALSHPQQPRHPPSSRRLGTDGRTRLAVLEASDAGVSQIGIRDSGFGSETKTLEHIAAVANDLLVVDPDVARAGEDVDVRARLPGRAGLAAVRIAERDVDARNL